MTRTPAYQSPPTSGHRFALPATRPRRVLHFTRGPPAVGFDFVDIVERFEVEIGDEFAAVEGFFAVRNLS